MRLKSLHEWSLKTHLSMFSWVVVYHPSMSPKVFTTKFWLLWHSMTTLSKTTSVNKTSHYDENRRKNSGYYYEQRTDCVKLCQVIFYESILRNVRHLGWNSYWPFWSLFPPVLQLSVHLQLIIIPTYTWCNTSQSLVLSAILYFVIKPQYLRKSPKLCSQMSLNGDG